MKIVKSNESNVNRKGISATTCCVDGSSSKLLVVYKILFSKDEARAIARNREAWVLMNDINSEAPVVFSIDPFKVTKLRPVNIFGFIFHTLHIYSKPILAEVKFNVTLAREYNNNKIKARAFEIVMWVEAKAFSKSGVIPDNLLSKGKGWLSSIITQMIMEYVELKIKQDSVELQDSMELR